MQRQRVGSVETPVIFFAVCGPKFTKLVMHTQERLQFATPFSVRRYLVSFRRHSRSCCELVQNLPEILRFLERRFFSGGGAPNFLPNFINSSYPRTCVKIWWRSTEQRALSHQRRCREWHFTKNKKAVISQRWPRNAPYIWVPWKISGLPDYTHANYLKNFTGFCSDGTVPIYRPSYILFLYQHSFARNFRLQFWMGGLRTPNFGERKAVWGKG